MRKPLGPSRSSKPILWSRCFQLLELRDIYGPQAGTPSTFAGSTVWLNREPTLPNLHIARNFFSEAFAVSTSFSQLPHNVFVGGAGA